MTEWVKTGPHSWVWDGDWNPGDPQPPEEGKGTCITVLGHLRGNASLTFGGTP